MQALTPVKRYNGYALVIAILRQADPIWRKKMLEGLSKHAPLLVQLASEFEFIFDDIVRLDDLSIQKLLTIIPDECWVRVWMLTRPKLKQLLLKNMSSRRRVAFLEDVDCARPLPRKSIRRLQSHIAHQTHLLLKQGKLGMHAKRYSG